jgi:uncharacterized phiE125 gp8 family phage protein
MDPFSITENTTEPVSTAEAKIQLRVDHTNDDTYIGGLVSAARRWCEHYQNRAYMTQTITLRRDEFADTMELPRPPLLSVSSIKYYDTDGNQQTVSTTLYDVDTTSEPGKVTLGYSDSWPEIQDIHHCVEIIFLAGYETVTTSADSVPETVKTAIKMLAGEWYANREEAADYKLNRVPDGVRSLLSIDRNITV